MTRLIFDPPPLQTLPIYGSDARAPVARIFCVGRNYEEHAKEMGHAVDREKPFYFTKSSSALTQSGATIPYPPGTINFHYEMELVVVIGSPAFRVSAAHAQNAVYGYACGLDMTRRDLQQAERAKQRPWDLGKDVEHSAVVGRIMPAAQIGALGAARIELRQNGMQRQSADLTDMVWRVPDIIAHLSQFYHLVPGDLIFTGTPAGVGPVHSGDRLAGSIERVGEIALEIGAPE